MYIYPDNLKAKATMWLWKLKDLAIIGIIVLLSTTIYLWLISLTASKELSIYKYKKWGFDYYFSFCPSI